MKKIVTLMMVLLLVFAITLTGCGGGTDEPATTPDQETEEVAEATITQADLIEQYNACASLFNELDELLAGYGIYDDEAEVKANMDAVYELLGMAEVVVQSEDLTDDESLAVYDEMQEKIDMMNEYKDTYL